MERRCRCKILRRVFVGCGIHNAESISCDANVVEFISERRWKLFSDSINQSCVGRILCWNCCSTFFKILEREAKSEFGTWSNFDLKILFIFLLLRGNKGISLGCFEENPKIIKKSRFTNSLHKSKNNNKCVCV